MKTLIKFPKISIFSLLVVFLLLPAVLQAAGPAMTISEARVNRTLLIGGLNPGADIEFVLNGGVPVFAIADAAGTAKYLPLLEGSLEIIIMQNGIVIDRATVTVLPSLMAISEARVNSTLIVSGLPPGATVQFVLSGGVPVFAIADAAGTARYLPLLEGSLEIIIIQNGIVIDRATVTVLPSLMAISEARVNTTLIVSGLPPGAEVQFILNGGVPVFAMADAGGTARFLPLLEGSLEIIARQNGVIIGRAMVTVLPEVITPVLKTIAVSPSSAMVAVGDRKTFTALPKDQFGNPIAATVTWSSSNITVGTISSVGVFLAKVEGFTTITAASGSVSGTAMVTVTAEEVEAGEVERPPSARSGGGGTGGGGVTSSEPLENIEKAERHVKAIIANTPVTYNFASPEHGLDQIVITGNENENDIMVKVELLKGTAKGVTAAPPGTVYKNLNILAGTKSIKKAVIKFRVDNTWIQNNNLVAGDIKMLRWDGSKWAQLETRETSKDGTYTRFETTATSFSNFVIAGLKSEAPAPAVAMTETPAKPAKSPVAAVPTPKAAGFKVVLAIAAIGAIIMLWRKRR